MAIPEDIFFLHSLFDYHQRREDALGYAIASNLLLSIASSILFFSTLAVIESSKNTKRGAELLATIGDNKQKIRRLTKKIRSSRSINRQRTWYKIILRLSAEIMQAEYELKELADG